MDFYNYQEYGYTNSVGDTNSEYIVERYYGKTKILEECERTIAEIIRRSKESPELNINMFPESKRLEKLIQQQFGFRNVCIYWKGSYVDGAGTHVSSHAIRYVTRKTNKLLDGSGYYDSDHSLFLLISLSYGLIHNYDLTEREILATILHEVGHNFDVSIYQVMDYLLKIIFVEWKEILISEICTNEYTKTLISSIDKIDDHFIQSIPILKRIHSILTNVEAKLTHLLTLVSSPLATIKILPKLIFFPIANIRHYFNKKKEEFSDSMATAYGYGSDLSSAIIKLTTSFSGLETLLPDNVLTRIFYDIGTLYVEMFLTLGDHGNTQERVKKMLTRLEIDLEKGDVPPEMRAELKQEIKTLEKIYNDYISLSDGKKLVLTKCFRYFTDKYFGGVLDIFYKPRRLREI